jgi:hypothetical protein
MIRKYHEMSRNCHGLAQPGEPEAVLPHPSWLLSASCRGREPKMGASRQRDQWLSM